MKKGTKPEAAKPAASKAAAAPKAAAPKAAKPAKAAPKAAAVTKAKVAAKAVKKGPVSKSKVKVILFYFILFICYYDYFSCYFLGVVSCVGCVVYACECVCKEVNPFGMISGSLLRALPQTPSAGDVPRSFVPPKESSCPQQTGQICYYQVEPTPHSSP